jgi:hypothetical protein
MNMLTLVKPRTAISGLRVTDNRVGGGAFSVPYRLACVSAHGDARQMLAQASKGGWSAMTHETSISTWTTDMWLDY